MDSQHSTDAEETPTTETADSDSLQDVLDGPIDTKPHLIQHHAKMARLLAKEVLEEEGVPLDVRTHGLEGSGPQTVFLANLHLQKLPPVGHKGEKSCWFSDDNRPTSG
ncbi:MAG: hypothetical protein ABEL51_01825 [Salinibacter sp.]